MNSFYNWLAAYRNEGSPTGDLARDVAEDNSWPTNENDPQALYEYLENMGASDAALSAFEDAYEQFSGQPFPRDHDDDEDDED